MKNPKISASPDQAEIQRRREAAVDCFNMLDMEIPASTSDAMVEKLSQKLTGIIWRLVNRELEINKFVQIIKDFEGATSLYFN